jgi:adenine-specific DNA methylase
MYFQNENAIKIDIIRLQIEKWKEEGKLSDDEYFYLLACYDYPVIKGITGMREYDKQKSVFCKKKTVADAFETLVRDCKSRYIIISYNNEGLINTKQLSDICYGYAKDDSFKLIEMDYRRYKNKIPRLIQEKYGKYDFYRRTFPEKYTHTIYTFKRQRNT